MNQSQIFLNIVANISIYAMTWGFIVDISHLYTMPRRYFLPKVPFSIITSKGLFKVLLFILKTRV